MKNKSLTFQKKEYTNQEHPTVKGLRIIDGNNNFSISWLNKMGYCEYQLYLEHLKGIEAPDTPQMTKGTTEHKASGLSDHWIARNDRVRATWDWQGCVACASGKADRQQVPNSWQCQGVRCQLFVLRPSLMRGQLRRLGHLIHSNFHSRP